MRLKRHLIIVFSILSLNACLGGDQEVHEYVEEIKRTSVGKVSELPPEKEYTAQAYSAQNLRSPFDNMLPVTTSVTEAVDSKQLQRPDYDRRKQYLEQFPLDDLIMVGTLSKQNYIWGLVQDKSGMVHAVKVGDYLGQNSGVVKSITGTEINIVETISNGQGGWKDSPNSLRLNAE